MAGITAGQALQMRIDSDADGQNQVMSHERAATGLLGAAERVQVELITSVVTKDRPASFFASLGRSRPLQPPRAGEAGSNKISKNSTRTAALEQAVSFESSDPRTLFDLAVAMDVELPDDDGDSKRHKISHVLCRAAHAALLSATHIWTLVAYQFTAHLMRRFRIESISDPVAISGSISPAAGSEAAAAVASSGSGSGKRLTARDCALRGLNNLIKMRTSENESLKNDNEKQQQQQVDGNIVWSALEVVRSTPSSQSPTRRLSQFLSLVALKQQQQQQGDGNADDNSNDGDDGHDERGVALDVECKSFQEKIKSLLLCSHPALGHVLLLLPELFFNSESVADMKRMILSAVPDRMKWPDRRSAWDEHQMKQRQHLHEAADDDADDEESRKKMKLARKSKKEPADVLGLVPFEGRYFWNEIAFERLGSMLRLDVADRKIFEGAPLQIYRRNASAAQRFFLERYYEDDGDSGTENSHYNNNNDKNSRGENETERSASCACPLFYITPNLCRPSRAEASKMTSRSDEGRAEMVLTVCAPFEPLALYPKLPELRDRQLFRLLPECVNTQYEIEGLYLHSISTRDLSMCVTVLLDDRFNGAAVISAPMFTGDASNVTLRHCSDWHQKSADA